MISVFTPAFNEAANLAALYERLAPAMDALGVAWEWIIIDDHSPDGTFAIVEQLARRDPRVHGVRFARNSGSHVAISCGLHRARGDAAVMLAADLQDPPETLPLLVDRWRRGAQVVWAVRKDRPGSRRHAGFAAFYYWVMRRVVGMTGMPARGADFFLVDRAVIDAFKRHPERNVSVLALITWLGFRQEQIEYDKQPRAGGQSGWTMSRKIKLVVDSVVSFSDLPIKLIAVTGGVLLAASALLFAVGLALLPGFGAGIVVVVAVLVLLSGLHMLALGLLGEYLWRALDEARQRPAYLIEAVTEPHSGGLQGLP